MELKSFNTANKYLVIHTVFVGTWGRKERNSKGSEKSELFLGSSFFPHFYLIPKFKIYPVGLKNAQLFLHS